MQKTTMTFLLALVGIGATYDPTPTAVASPELTTRVAELERRVSALEGARPAPAGETTPTTKPATAATTTNTTTNTDTNKPKAPAAGEFLVPVAITGKEFHDASPMRNGTWEDTVLMNLRYDFTHLTKPARAIKGTLEFADLFGEVKFRLRDTITDPVAKGGEHTSTGSGFRYNQFRDGERWVRDASIKDIRLQLRVQQVIYEDGTTAEFR